MVSIKDIAKQVGMSPATVSRVVNGKNHVKDEKRQEILKVIAETGYVPNQAARNMVLQRTFTVGIVIPDTFNMFQRQLFSIIERHLESFGYHTMFFFVKFDGSSEEECLSRLKSEKLEGVILLHEIMAPRFYEYVVEIQLPVVAVTFNHDTIPSLHVDDRLAAFQGVRHLLGMGHRRIAIISGNGFSFGNLRGAGFFQALEAEGIPRDEGRVVSVQHYTPEFGMYGMRELLLRGRDFSAVFAATDELAIGAIRVLKDESIRVPEDVSVVGFDDIEISNYVIPRLTTIRQPLGEIGEQTALMIHRCITGQHSMELEQIFPHQLIIRESTALPL
ncbi:MAG: LacI family transcriptional regulator [Treponema sp.]|jgi:LacI family transcriptional regulator|nr:LacI family transcriptional regulator [Treponema sp.]